MTSTWPPGLVKAGLVVTEVTWTKVLRAVSEPVIDWVISGAPSAVAVTVKLKGASAVVEVEVSVTVSDGYATRAGVAWPGASVIDDWLEAARHAGGEPGKAEVVGRRLAAGVLQLELEGGGGLGLNDLAGAARRS